MPNGDVFPCHVLTEREFRGGNVREQSLVEICRRNGLLGQLKSFAGLVSVAPKGAMR
jgi:radical SAM protein with 4Fe4S-binding SPASM domain